MLDKYISVELMLNKSHFIFQDQICLWDYMDMQWWHHPQAKELLSWEHALLEECLNWRNQWSGQTMQIEHIPGLLLFQFQMSWFLNKIEMAFSYPWPPELNIFSDFFFAWFYKIYHLFEIHVYMENLFVVYLINE